MARSTSSPDVRLDEVKEKARAVLFSVGKWILLDDLARVMRVRDREEVKGALAKLKAELDAQQGALVLLQDADKFKLTVQDRFRSVVEKVVKQTELPKTVIETLAVIAYKAPMLQSELINIRTNKAYDHLVILEELEYITREKYGRTKLIKLTPKFFEYFEISEEELQKKFSEKSKLEGGELQAHNDNPYSYGNATLSGEVKVYDDANGQKEERAESVLSGEDPDQEPAYGEQEMPIEDKATNSDDAILENDVPVKQEEAAAQDNDAGIDQTPEEEPLQNKDEEREEEMWEFPDHKKSILEEAEEKERERKKERKKIVEDEDDDIDTTSGGFTEFSEHEKDQIEDTVDEVLEGE